MSFNPQFARIGEVLVHEKLVSEDQIKEALIKQSNFGLKIGETLIIRTLSRTRNSQFRLLSITKYIL